LKRGARGDSKGGLGGIALKRGARGDSLEKGGEGGLPFKGD